MKVRVQFRRAASTAWARANVVLASGEVGFETDTSRIKFGDGTRAWADLPYANLASTGTLLSLTAGEGLTGGTITTSGIIAVDKNYVATLEDTQTISNKVFGSTTEYLTSITTNSSDTSITIDLSQGPVYYISLNTNITSVNFINVPAYNTYSYFTIMIRNNGNFSINWPLNIHWQDGTAPILSGINKEDIYYFSTIDAGTTYYATTLGAGYNNPNTPVTQTARFNVTSQYNFGSSSALSGSGSVAAVANEASGSTPSNITIYYYDGTIWRQQAVITGATVPNSKAFGYSLALNYDGSVLVIGDPLDSTDAVNAGRARIYNQISGGAWIEAAVLDIADPSRDKQVGYSVSINDAGDVAFVGAPATSGLNGIGSVYIFSKSGGFWSQSTKLNQPGNTQNTAFGTSVSTDSTGTYLAIGSPKANQAHFYNKVGTNWIRQATVFPTNAPTQNRFGTVLTMSGDANFCVVGDPTGGIGGYAAVFGRSGTNWVQVQIITEATDNIGNNFPTALKLSADGSQCFFTAKGHNTNTGIAYVYMRSGLAFSEDVTFAPVDAAAGINFGQSGSMSADSKILLATAPGATSAYFFKR